MDSHDDSPQKLANLAATVEATPDGLSSGSRDRQRVELVEGSGPGLSTVTDSLLRRRLRAAALVLFSGTGAFLLWGFIRPANEFEWPPALFWSHVGLTVVLGLFGIKMCVSCPVSGRRLRLYEILIFGLPAAFFIALQQYNLSSLCGIVCGETDPKHTEAAGHLLASVRGSAGLWFTLIFTYTIFIPNTWRRAAAMLGPLAAAPVVLTIVARWRSPVIAEVVPVDYVVEQALMMFIAFDTAVFGTYTIGSLRREAFQARQLGQYRLKRLLGAGGMGEVYLAEHQLLKRPCAVKLIRPSKSADPRALARFEREVRTTAGLTHWNTVEIFDFGRTDDGTFYYAMEYLPGMSLAELVERHGPLPAERAIRLLSQTCGALREAHSVGLIHRDIKPGNIFAAQRGGVYDVAKLLDFGLVKPAAGQESMDLTQEGAITGSPLYMAPEQAMGESEPDARSDIYSLGAVAYYLLTGRPPFDGSKPLAVLFAHAHDAVVPPSQIRSDVPHDLEQVVLRCLAKRPEDRFADAGSMRQALLECAAAGQWTEERAEQWWQGEASNELIMAG
jgi:serine/threonine-protein kinase